MVEVIDAVRMVKQNPKAVKLIWEIMSGKIDEVKPNTKLATKSDSAIHRLRVFLRLRLQRL